ncbi:MAG: ABC transporter permease subunit [Propionibacteriaceae bacterium]|nr:ABC transporter permease subunit [Propionibacteriaceae bacterium]
MTNLLRAELLRIASSRIMIWIALLGVAVGSVVGMSLAELARPVTNEDITEAQVALGDRLIAIEEDCRASATPCDQEHIIQEVPLEDFIRTPLAFEDLLRGTSSATGSIALFAAVVAVTVVIGSEFTSGSLGTQLTFTPRRLPVLWAKTLTGMLTGGAIMAWWLLVGFLINVVVFLQLRGATDLLAGPAVAAELGRYLLLGLWGGLLAALLTMALGSALRAWVVIAAVFQISLILDGVGGTWEWLLPTSVLEALANGYWVTYLMTATGEDAGSVALSYPAATAYAVVVTVAFAIWACISFTRRDIRK